LFPQVLAIVRGFLRTRVEYQGVNPKEIGLERYRSQVVERLLAAIEPDEQRGEAALLPRVERFRPKGSTKDVVFATVRPCRPTLKSHVSHVVLDSEVWEGSAAFELEAAAARGVVLAYARNDHLGFTIPYEWEERPHTYTPDYLVRLANGLALILEIKGQEREQDRQKYAAARRWVSAVNNARQYGPWAFVVCTATATLPGVLAEVAATSPAG
jgi:type III restriction enzyme